jgi:hypothetical protein
VRTLMRRRMSEGTLGTRMSLFCDRGIYFLAGDASGAVEVDSLNTDRGNDVSDLCKRTALIDF